MILSDATAAAAPAAALLQRARRVLVLTHLNPDGDAIGSLLGMAHVLHALGKQVIAMAYPSLPQYVRWLPGAESIEIYRAGTTFPEVDLLVITDTAAAHRLGPIWEDYAAVITQLPMVVIDHHLTNDGMGVVNLIDASASSTCELVYELLVALALPIDAATATCLLMGLTTDTQSFQTSATGARALRAAAALIEQQADRAQIVDSVYNALPAASALLIGRALAEMHSEHGVSWTTVTHAMVRETGAEDAAADEVVRVLQRVAEARALVLFKERSDGTTKLSLRSRPPIDVARFAQRWGGGGHAQASGATLQMSPERAQAEVVPLLQSLVRG